MTWFLYPDGMSTLVYHGIKKVLCGLPTVESQRLTDSRILWRRHLHQKCNMRPDSRRGRHPRHLIAAKIND